MRIWNILFLLFFIAVIGISAIATSVASTNECDLKKVSIDPLASSNNTIFIGKINATEVRFRNESHGKVIDVFPEPPLLVTNLNTKKQCALDGGVWVRDGVYLSSNEKLLVTHEYTGSNDFLALYNLPNCKKTTEIDISGKIYSIQKNTITLGTQCANEAITSCEKLKKVMLSNNCEIIK